MIWCACVKKGKKMKKNNDEIKAFEGELEMRDFDKDPIEFQRFIKILVNISILSRNNILKEIKSTFLR